MILTYTTYYCIELYKLYFRNIIASIYMKRYAPSIALLIFFVVGKHNFCYHLQLCNASLYQHFVYDIIDKFYARKIKREKVNVRQYLATERSVQSKSEKRIFTTER